MDNGRREREGFDQNGTVRVIQVAPSSTPTRRAQRASSVFQDIEGAAAREAKRKPCDGERDTNGSPAGTGQIAARNPFQIDRETDMPQGQSKRPRLADDTDAQSPSPAGISKTTKSIPVFYNDMSAPSFAYPRGHRRHLSTTSTGSSPEKGLGLGITASPFKLIAPKPNVTSNGSPGPSDMPPPPTAPRRRSLRGRTNSPPPQSFLQDDTPLGAEKPQVRKPGSVRGKASSQKFSPTRSSQKIPGSGKESHRTTPSTGGNGVSKKKHSNDEYEERDRKEFQDVKALLKGSKTNPECLPILKEMSDFHEEILRLKADSTFKSGDRYIRLKNVRRNLTRRRVKLELFRRKGELSKEFEVHSTSSEDESTERKTDEGSDEESLADLFIQAPKRPRVEQRDLPADSAVARRISSLRGPSKSAGIGDNRPMHDGETPDGNSLQAVVTDTGSEQVSLPVRTSAAPYFRSPGLALDGPQSQYRIADVSDDPTTDSEGDDIPFEPTGIPFEPSSAMHNSNVAQEPSPISRPVEAELAEDASGHGVDTTARYVWTRDPFARGLRLMIKVESSNRR